MSIHVLVNFNLGQRNHFQRVCVFSHFSPVGPDKVKQTNGRSGSEE